MNGLGFGKVVVIASVRVSFDLVHQNWNAHYYVLSFLQGSYPVWEDFINKAGKLQSQLR